MINFLKRNKEDSDKENVDISSELEQSLQDSEMTPTRDFLMSLAKVVGIVVIVVVLFLGGRWLLDRDSDDTEPNIGDSSQEAQHNNEDNTNTANQDAGKVTVAEETETTKIDDHQEEDDTVTISTTIVVNEPSVDTLTDAGFENSNLILLVSLATIFIASTIWHKFVYNLIASRK